MGRSRSQVLSSKAHSPSAGTRPRAASASPTSGRRSIRDRPQDYVTASRRHTRAYRSAALMRTRSAQNRQREPLPTTARRHYVTLSGPAHPNHLRLVTATGLRHSSASVCEGQREGERRTAAQAYCVVLPEDHAHFTLSPCVFRRGFLPCSPSFSRLRPRLSTERTRSGAL